MAAPIPVAPGGLWEVRLNGFVDGQQCITTFHYINEDAVTDVILESQALAAQFATDIWIPLILPALSTGYINAYVDAQCIRPIRYRSQRNIPAQRAGTIGGDCSPSGVSIVVRRQLDRAGRKYQGRIYLAGIAESTTVNSTVTTGWFIANDASLRAAVLFNIVTATPVSFKPVIIHPGAVTLADEVTIAKVDVLIRYQRRREVGVGI